jgi:hypothetical protein
MNGKETARFPTADGLAAQERRLAAANRRIRAANVSLYAGLAGGAAGIGIYLFATATRSWWVAALILLLPLIGVSRLIIRRL